MDGVSSQENVHEVLWSTSVECPAYHVGHLKLSNTITTIECSPFQESAGLLGVGGNTSVSVFLRQPLSQKANFLTSSSSFGWTFHEFPLELLHGTRVVNIAWSPLSSSPSTSSPDKKTVLSFCTTGVNKKVQYISQSFDGQLRAEGSDKGQISTIGAHSDHINACTFLADPKLHVATVSDDLSCKIWDVEAQAEALSFPLSSPGWAVKSHPQSQYQILVGEENGKVKIFDLRSGKVIVTFHTQEQQLLAADWDTNDINLIGAVSGSDWYLWELQQAPSHTTRMQKGQALQTQFKFSPRIPSTFATTSYGSPLCTVWTTDAQNTMIHVGGKVTGMSWFADEPCLLLSDQNEIFFYQLGL